MLLLLLNQVFTVFLALNQDFYAVNLIKSALCAILHAKNSFNLIKTAVFS